MIFIGKHYLVTARVVVMVGGCSTSSIGATTVIVMDKNWCNFMQFADQPLRHYTLSYLKRCKTISAQEQIMWAMTAARLVLFTAWNRHIWEMDGDLKSSLATF